MSVPLCIVHGGCISLFVGSLFPKVFMQVNQVSRHADRTVNLEIKLTDMSGLGLTDFIHLDRYITIR